MFLHTKVIFKKPPECVWPQRLVWGCVSHETRSCGPAGGPASRRQSGGGGSGGLAMPLPSPPAASRTLWARPGSVLFPKHNRSCRIQRPLHRWSHSRSHFEKSIGSKGVFQSEEDSTSWVLCEAQRGIADPGWTVTPVRRVNTSLWYR